MKFPVWHDEVHPPLRPVHTGPRFTPQENRHIFREMVRAEAREGWLSARRRRRLIQYAAALDLKPLEASRIVTEVCHEESIALPEPPLLYRVVESTAQTHRWPVWLKITLVLLGAFAVDRLVRQLV